MLQALGVATLGESFLCAGRRNETRGGIGAAWGEWRVQRLTGIAIGMGAAEKKAELRVQCGLSREVAKE